MTPQERKLIDELEPDEPPPVPDNKPPLPLLPLGRPLPLLFPLPLRLLLPFPLLDPFEPLVPPLPLFWLDEFGELVGGVDVVVDGWSPAP